MRRLPIILTLSLLAAGVVPLRAQSLEAFKRQLAAPLVGEWLTGDARVVASEAGDAAQAVAEASRSGSRLRLRGYRVCIFFDNGQDARAGAVAAKSLFEQNYPGERVYMVYENPYFKVTVGNCLTTEEAIILKGRVSPTFPKAFLKNEELSLADLLR